MRGATQLATNGFAIRAALVTGTVMKHDTTPRSIGTLDMPARCRSLRMYLRLSSQDGSWDVGGAEVNLASFLWAFRCLGDPVTPTLSAIRKSSPSHRRKKL